MIVLFHTFFIVTKYILTVISKSIFCRNCDVNGEPEESPKLSINGTDYTPINDSEADFEEGVGIRFFPPVYVQRYNAVKKSLEECRCFGNIKKIVDFGCAEFGFFPYVKHFSGLQEVVAVDIDHDLLERFSCRAAPLNSDYLNNRQEPLTVRVFGGSIADRDPRLIGTDAVVCIELIEHLYPDDLEAIPYTVFGFIQPLIAIFTTPNSDFNVLFTNFTGFRHPDHKFEWTRSQFENWAHNITTRYPAYYVKIQGIGRGPKGTEVHGCCSQMAVFIKSPQHRSIQQASLQEKLEVQDSEEVYKVVKEYSFPFRVDNRTDQEKIRDQAEYYIRLLSSDEKYYTDSGIHIPLRRLLPHVSTWCNSVSSLRTILEEAGWIVVEQDELAVIYPEERSSAHGSEGYDWEEQEGRLTCPPISDNVVEDWDTAQTLSLDNDDWNVPRVRLDHDNEFGISSWISETSEDVCTVNLENRTSENVELKQDVNLHRDRYLESQDHTQNSNMSDCYENKRDNIRTSSDEHSASCESAQSTHASVEHLKDMPVNVTVEPENKISTNSVINDGDNKSLVSVKFEASGANVCQSSVPIVYNTTKEIFINREFNQNCASVNDVKLNPSKQLHFEKHNDGTLMGRKAETKQEVKKVSSSCSRSDCSGITEKHNKSSILYKNSHFANEVSSNSLNANFASDYVVLEHTDPTCNVEMRGNVSHNVVTNEGSSVELLCLNLVENAGESTDTCHKLGESLNLTSVNSSTHESLLDRSLVESSSLDEQNDKAVDSGYPNSFSVQDMEMDLTPEQVDEISMESEEILSENTSLNSGEDSEYESESSEENERIDNNEGFLFRFRHEIMYDPIALAVENGDVANNNRDGEGNNAVAIVPPPPEPEVFDFPDPDIIPLLAAAEDFDNDNDVILPNDIQPFPPWLLNLLGLVNHGGGDLHNYIMPPLGDGVILFPDEGLGDIDNDNDDGSDTSSSASYEGDDSDVGSDDGGGSELEDAPAEEIVLPGDVGGGGEPNLLEDEP